MTKFLELAAKPGASEREQGYKKREKPHTLLPDKSSADICGVIKPLTFSSFSMGTVNTHCTNIYRKAGVGSVKEFTGFILSNGVNEKKMKHKARKPAFLVKIISVNDSKTEENMVQRKK